jgi:hypothetical protein
VFGLTVALSFSLLSATENASAVNSTLAKNTKPIYSDDCGFTIINTTRTTNL